MICDGYYESHETLDPEDGTDICSIPEIGALTARAVSILGASITVNGDMTSRPIRKHTDIW